MEHINKSWREQRKGVMAKAFGHTEEFISLWQAAHAIARIMPCKAETAKKEIKKAIKTGAVRYGFIWSWKK